MRGELQPLVSAEGMRRADTAAVETWGIPGRDLMENAGRAASQLILSRFKIAGRHVVVVCGRGNNGGDGYVVARLLHAAGAAVTVAGPEVSVEAAPDAAANRERFMALADESASLHLYSSTAEISDSPELIVDAVLGIGVSGALRDPEASLCAWVNDQACPVASLDVPSGLNADFGTAPAGTVRADLTITFGAAKTGLLLGAGPKTSGAVVVVAIGIPADELETNAIAHRPPREWISARLPIRSADANKYSVGQALCVVGSRAFSGAAVLGSLAAMRAGAGAVVACTPASAQTVVNLANTEVMIEALPETDEGTLSITAYDAIVERMSAADAILIGCGLGRSAETKRLVHALLRRATVPTVLDADGLNAFAGQTDKFTHHEGGRLVLTPHEGELRRLVGPDLDLSDRIATVRDLSKRWNAVLVLKGMPSIVGAPDGRVVIGPPPDTILATAGAGDVLAGSIVGLLAQGLDVFDAACVALAIGSKAAQLAASHLGGSTGLIASDFVTSLPEAIATLCAPSH